MVKTPNRKVTGKTLVYVTLLVLMIVGATVGGVTLLWKNYFPGVELDMFFCGCNDCDNGVDQTFPARKYTKYISWDILINHCLCICYQSGYSKFQVSGFIAHGIIDMSDDYSPHVLLAVYLLSICLLEHN